MNTSNETKFVQQQFIEGVRSRRVSGPFNDLKNGIQRIRIGEGCPWQHPYCKEPTEHHYYGIPEPRSNKIQILDMNLLSYRETNEDFFDKLGNARFNGKVIQYEMVCGWDWRLLTDLKARWIHDARFIKPRIAFDGPVSEQKDVYIAIRALEKSGYKNEDIQVFMLCNYIIPFKDCCRKLDLLKVWNVHVCDCYFDGQTSPRIIEKYWKSSQIKQFRRMCRAHNQIVRFKFFPKEARA